MVLIAHHNNFLTEVDVGVELNVRRQLGIERGLTAIDAVAEGFPVGCRADAEGAPPPPLFLRQRRYGEHEDKQEETEPLNDVLLFHIEFEIKKLNILLVIGERDVVTTFSGRLPCMFLSVPGYVVQDG